MLCGATRNWVVSGSDLRATDSTAIALLRGHSIFVGRRFLISGQETGRNADATRPVGLTSADNNAGSELALVPVITRTRIYCTEALTNGDLLIGSLAGEPQRSPAFCLKPA